MILLLLNEKHVGVGFIVVCLFVFSFFLLLRKRRGRGFFCFLIFLGVFFVGVFVCDFF